MKPVSTDQEKRDNNVIQTDPTAAAAIFGPLNIPDSPAPRGYLANPYRKTVEEAHQLLEQYMSPDADFSISSIEDGLEIAVRPRKPEEEASKIPIFRGSAFIANVRPIEVLACIHLFSYRLIWDTRLSSGRIVQRYGYYQFLFYIVYRGIGPMYRPRDAGGIQDVRCWNGKGELQADAFPDTEKIDIVYRSVQTPDIPLQEGKVRMHINLGAYRIEWVEALQGCNVTFVGDADLAATVPMYIWKAFSKEFPRTVGRLRGAMEQFGVPPYVLDLQDCVVIQTTFYYSQDRRTTMRHHVKKPGSYSIMIDRQRMYPLGITRPAVEGEGSGTVHLQDCGDRLMVTVGSEGIGREYVITITPRDAESLPNSFSGWW